MAAFIPVLNAAGPGDANGERIIAFDDQQSFWSRHIVLEQAESIARFNYMDDIQGNVLSADSQFRIRTRTKLNLTAGGSTYLRFRAETGSGFNNSWNNVGIGRSAGQPNFYLKTLSLGQKIGRHLELNFGGMDFEQGSGTQHTYASNDSAFVGSRLQVNDALGFMGIDNLSFTAGNVRIYGNASVFPRLANDLGRLNYAQIIAKHNFGEAADGSAEMTFLSGVCFERAAVHVRRPVRKVFDEAWAEVVARSSFGAAAGFSGTLSRALSADGNWKASLIYSQMPPELYLKSGRVLLLNQGEIDAGKRLSAGASYNITNNLAVSAFGGRLLDTTPAKRYVAQFGVAYDYTGLINRFLQSSKQ